MAAHYEEYVHRDRSPSSPRLARPLSPPAGFAVGALLRGANVQDPLPVLESDDGLKEGLRQQMTLQNFQRRRQLIFERSQTRRQEAFERAIQKRRQTFNVNEVKRQTGFRKKQRERKATAAEKEEEREDFFMRA